MNHGQFATRQVNRPLAHYGQSTIWGERVGEGADFDICYLILLFAVFLAIFKKRVPVFLIIRFIELLIKLVRCHAFPYKSHLLDEQKKQ